MPGLVLVDAHLLGVILEALRLRSLAARCFTQRPGFLIGLTQLEVELLRDVLRVSELGIETIEYFLSELTAAEEEAGNGN